MPSLRLQTSFVGKVPSQADFLRIQAGTPAAQALHRWMEEGNEALARGALQLPAEPTHFVFAGAEGLQTGVVAPGRDRVGRTFPSAVFASAAPFPELPLLPRVLGPFLKAASTLLARTGETDAAELTRSLGLLPAPTDEALALARQERRSELMAPQGGRLQTVFEGQGVAGSHFYGLRTFLAACDAEKRGEPGRAGLALDCPLAPESGLDVAFWADLFVRRCPRWMSVNLLWTERRLLLGFGAPAAVWFLFLAKPDHPGMKRWPLVTQQVSAVEAAKSSLSAAARGVLERREAPLDELLGGLASG